MDPVKIFMEMKYSIKALDYVFGWETHFDNIKKVRVIYEISKALKYETALYEKCNDEYDKQLLRLIIHS